MKCHRAITSRFQAAAPTYETHADIQRQVAETLAAMAGDWIRQRGIPRRCLEIGCGTGLLTHAVRAAWPMIDLVATDIALTMVQKARQDQGRFPVTWLVADAAHLPFSEQFPLVISSSALHWVTPFAASAGEIARVLVPGGSALLGIMLEGTLAELHEARRRVIPRKIPRGRLPREDEVVHAFQRKKFSVRLARRKTLTARYPSASAFLRALHEQGLTAGEVSQADRPLTRRELATLQETYEHDFPHANGGVRASYEVLFLSLDKDNGSCKNG